jgi:hypothetical protein
MTPKFEYRYLNVYHVYWHVLVEKIIVFSLKQFYVSPFSTLLNAQCS